jgi:hypothetical protein
MKIDWKTVCQSAGYKSLKAEYTRSMQRLQRYTGTKNTWYVEREKKELKDKFQWVIARATHYAHHINTTIDVILNDWEEKRSYSWQNYYQESNQPKLNKSVFVKQRKTLNWLKFELKTSNSPRSKIYAKRRRFDFILEEQKKNSKRKGKLARWSKNKRWLRDHRAGKLK